MSKLNWKNQNGQSNGKQIIIIAGITIATALMIVAIFVILSKNKPTDATTNDFLKNIEAQRQKQNSLGNGNNSPDNSQTALSYTGILMEIKTDSIVITEKESKNKITLFLTPETPVTYNGALFSRSKFFIGDQLEISAVNLGDKLRAESIKVLVSASPATAAPVPPAANVRPDGSIKPL